MMTRTVVTSSIVPACIAGARRAAAGSAVLLLAALCWLAFPRTAAGQQAAVITGRVVDTSGVPIPAASVRLQGGAAPRTTAGDDGGAFRFDDVPPGSYTLSAARLGFEPATVPVAVAAGEVRQVELRLQTATLMLEEIRVEALGGADRERARFDSEAGVTARVTRDEAEVARRGGAADDGGSARRRRAEEVHEQAGLHALERRR